MDITKFKKMPIILLTKPTDGAQVYLDYYWLVTEDNCVLFYNGLSPQCNKIEAVSKHMAEKWNLECKFIPLAYIPRKILNEWERLNNLLG